MRLPILISLSLVLFAWQSAIAQLAPADDFFNSGAQFYISNNIPAALQKVETGLKIYPDNVKLKKLEQLLKQQQKQQKKNQKNQQKKQQQQQKNQQSSQKNRQSQQQKQQQKQQQNQSQKQKAQQKKQQQKSSAAQKKQAQEQKKKAGQKQPLKPGQMTPNEAKRLLNQLKGNEQMLQLKPKAKPNENQNTIEDW